MICDIHCFIETDRSDEPTNINEFEIGEKKLPTNETETSPMNERRLTTTSNETPFTLVDHYVEDDENEVFDKGN